jgi:Spy/CpxP family protein refolding chaperone
VSIAWCFEVISQKSVRHELDRAPIRMVVVARLLEYLDFEDDLLGASARIEVVGRAPDSSLAVEFVAKLKPDMVLVSIGTCLFHGLKVIRILRHRFPEMVVADVSDVDFGSLWTFGANSESSDFVYKFRLQEDFQRVPTRRSPSRYAHGRRDKVPPPSHCPFPLSPQHSKTKGEIMKKIATFLLALTLGSLAFAQAPTPPSPTDQAQRQIKYLTTVLSLTTAQQQQAKTIYVSSATSEQAIHTSMRQAHDTLRTAVKNNDTVGIDEAANTIGLLTAQMESARAKADAALYQMLTEDQQAKLSDLQSQRGPMGGPDAGPAMGFR